MKRAVLFVVVAAILCVPAAWAGGKANTRVTLDNIQPTLGGTTVYSGDIFSSLRACKNQRRVLVYRVRPNAPDDKRGSTLSFKGTDTPGYFWLFEEEGVPPNGKYYSKVRPTEDCQGDRSPLYSFPS